MATRSGPTARRGWVHDERASVVEARLEPRDEMVGRIGVSIARTGRAAREPLVDRHFAIGFRVEPEGEPVAREALLRRAEARLSVERREHALAIDLVRPRPRVSRRHGARAALAGRTIARHEVPRVQNPLRIEGPLERANDVEPRAELGPQARRLRPPDSVVMRERPAREGRGGERVLPCAVVPVFARFVPAARPHVGPSFPRTKK